MNVAGDVGAPPEHYQGKGITPFEVIDDRQFGFYDGTAFKYFTRYQKKGTPKEDLKKALHYVKELRIRLENGQEEGFLTRFPAYPSGQVADAFEVTDPNVRSALMALLSWKISSNPYWVLDTCKYYLEQAIRAL